MEKIQENMCFDVVSLHENIRTCLFPCNVCMPRAPAPALLSPHYIIKDKGLFKHSNLPLSSVDHFSGGLQGLNSLKEQSRLLGDPCYE